jgi:signal peptidase I
VAAHARRSLAGALGGKMNGAIVRQPWGLPMRLSGMPFTLATLLAVCTLGCQNVWGPHIYRVPSGAMEPTIKRGQFVVVMRWPAGAIEVKRGDLIVFRATEEPDSLYIKRVIAVAGDRIELRKRELFLDGKHVEDPHAVWREAPQRLLSDLESYPPWTIPEGQVFVMGDNRYNSKDSRSFGPISLTSVVGWVVF